jgi:hypothetical protein
VIGRVGRVGRGFSTVSTTHLYQPYQLTKTWIDKQSPESGDSRKTTANTSTEADNMARNIKSQLNEDRIDNKFKPLWAAGALAIEHKPAIEMETVAALPPPLYR